MIACDPKANRPQLSTTDSARLQFSWVVELGAVNVVVADDALANDPPATVAPFASRHSADHVYV